MGLFFPMVGLLVRGRGARGCAILQLVRGVTTIVVCDRRFARRREEPIQRVEHASASCPDCQLPTQHGRMRRRRQVISIPRLRARMTEHVVLERTCRKCRRPWTTQPDWGALSVGRRRMGISMQSEVSVLGEAFDGVMVSDFYGAYNVSSRAASEMFDSSGGGHPPFEGATPPTPRVGPVVSKGAGNI